jgi:hypothetical protein
VSWSALLFCLVSSEAPCELDSPYNLLDALLDIEGIGVGLDRAGVLSVSAGLGGLGLASLITLGSRGDHPIPLR